MNNTPFPIIRIELEGVRRALVHSLHLGLEADKVEIQKQIEESLGKIDIGRMVDDLVQRETPIIIERAVKDCLNRVVYQEAQKIQGAVVKSLLKQGKKK